MAERIEPAPPAGEYPGWVASLAGWISKVFFRRVEVVGAELVPRDGPILFVANHGNGLVDPLLVMGCLPGRPRFLAKSTLWNNPVLRPFLTLAAVIPVHRRSDPGFDPGKNTDMFDQCRQVLARGGSVALFPEGRSHNEPALAQIKTGAARILEVPDPRVRRTAIVPVGLFFDVKSRFRSKALIRVGPPLSLEAKPPVEGEEEEAKEAVRQLTARIHDALVGVTLNYESWDEARLVARAAEIYLREPEELPRATPLDEQVATIAGVLSTYRRLQEESPESLEPLRTAVANYDHRLRSLGLRDEQVASDYPLRPVTGYLVRSALFLLFWLPLAAAGMALNLLPFGLCGVIASRFAHEPDQPASYKLFGGIVLYPVIWLIESVTTLVWIGPEAALAVFALAVLGGAASIVFLDRGLALSAETRAFLTLRLGLKAATSEKEVTPESGRQTWRSLRRQRAQIRQQFLEVSADPTPAET